MQSDSPGFSRIARAQDMALLTMLRVGEGRALRGAGGAGGELDVDRIARPQPSGDRVEAPAMAAASPGHDLVEAEAPRRRIGAELDHGAERRQAFGAQAPGPATIELRGKLPDHLDIGGSLELPRGDERLRADAVEGVFKLRGPIGGVDVDEDQPDARGRELGDEPLGPVRRPDADPVSLVQTEAQESRREPVHPPRELLVSPALAGGPEHRRGALGRGGARPRRGTREGVASTSGRAVDPLTCERPSTGAIPRPPGPGFAITSPTSRMFHLVRSPVPSCDSRPCSPEGRSGRVFPTRPITSAASRRPARRRRRRGR